MFRFFTILLYNSLFYCIECFTVISTYSPPGRRNIFISPEKTARKQLLFTLLSLMINLAYDPEAMDLSAPRLIYPMLDGFLLGDALSSHDGVRCYPAIQRMTQERFILKVISVPASQVQLDALLLTGAVASKEAALSYFHKQAEEIIHQAHILHQLSHQEGFVPYLDTQIVSMEEGVGYEVYLLGGYKRSLESLIPKAQMTQLEAIRMGLDLCAALSACRRAGYLYADLKPGNIFHSTEQGFRIGDLGFASLDALEFTSLPSKYLSRYTAPEMQDDFAVLNSTLDVYALGMVLWQVFNGGKLDPPIGQTLMPPMYADYELADILLKACDPNEKDRWQDPTAFAQALVEYMQRNEIGDTPIVPVIQEQAEEVPEEFLPEVDPEQLKQEMDALEEEEELILVPEDAPSAEELDQMLAQADELIAHTPPTPPVAPEPVEIPMPEPIVLPEEEDAPVEDVPPTPDEIEPEAAAPAEETKDTAPMEEAKDTAPVEKTAQKNCEEVPKPALHIPWRLISTILVICLLAASVVGGSFYYNNRYVQHIDALILSNEDDQLTVQVVSKIDDSLLTVICSDSYGNILQQPVAAGVAIFEDLNPQTRYTVRVTISGNHKLTGETSRSFSTAARTHVLSFTAGIGQTSDSVHLTLNTTGPQVEHWVLHYEADGETRESVEFFGNSTEVTGLTIGKTYTFTLSATDGRKIDGHTQVTYLATGILYAQDLQITAFGSGILTVQWQQCETYPVESWVVHCYNSAGFDQTITTDQLQYTFTGISQDIPCTVEVTAFGMCQGISIPVEANPITVLDFQYNLLEAMDLTVSWNYSGNAPQEGWFVYYTIGGGQEQCLHTTENSVTVPAIAGTTYEFRLEISQGQLFGGTDSYTAPAAQVFQLLGLHTENTQWQLCLRPQQENWNAEDLQPEDLRNEFVLGEQIGLLLSAHEEAAPSSQQVCIRLVILDQENTLAGFSTILLSWDEVWEKDCFAMDLPDLPAESGEYTLIVLINGMLANSQNFSLS